MFEELKKTEYNGITYQIIDFGQVSSSYYSARGIAIYYLTLLGSDGRTRRFEWRDTTDSRDVH